MKSKHLLIAMLRWTGAFSLALAGWSALAQEDFPQRPIRMVVGFGAGGAVDIGARALANAASKVFDRPVVVENVTGAGGGLALADLARRPNDGYTVAVTTSSYGAITSQLQKPSFNMDDIETLLGVAEFRHVMFTKADARHSSLLAIAESAKTSGNLLFSHLGAGTSLHIQGHLAFKALEVAPIQVPYRGAPDMIAAILGGHSDVGIADLSAVDSLLRAGKLRLVAATTKDRMQEYPQVPSLRELGVPDVDSLNPVLGVVIRKGTPPVITAKLREAFDEAARSREFTAAVAAAKMQIRVMQGAAFDTIVRQASRVAAPVIEEVNRGAGTSRN